MRPLCFTTTKNRLPIAYTIWGICGFVPGDTGKGMLFFKWKLTKHTPSRAPGGPLVEERVRQGAWLKKTGNGWHSRQLLDTPSQDVTDEIEEGKVFLGKDWW